jgi:large subunit ribosomal protein L28
MARACQVTEARPGIGHHVSHSHRRTKRRFNVNIQSKRYWVPSLGRHLTLAGTGYTYVTKENRRNDPNRLVLRKYDPNIRKHVEFREER